MINDLTGSTTSAKTEQLSDNNSTSNNNANTSSFWNTSSNVTPKGSTTQSTPLYIVTYPSVATLLREPSSPAPGGHHHHHHHLSESIKAEKDNDDNVVKTNKVGPKVATGKTLERYGNQVDVACQPNAEQNQEDPTENKLGRLSKNFPDVDEFLVEPLSVKRQESEEHGIVDYTTVDRLVVDHPVRRRLNHSYDGSSWITPSTQPLHQGKSHSVRVASAHYKILRNRTLSNQKARVSDFNLEERKLQEVKYFIRRKATRQVRLPPLLPFHYRHSHAGKAHQQIVKSAAKNEKNLIRRPVFRQSPRHLDVIPRTTATKEANQSVGTMTTRESVTEDYEDIFDEFDDEMEHKAAVSVPSVSVNTPGVHVTAPRAPSVAVKNQAANVQVNAPSVNATGPQLGGKSDGLLNLNMPSIKTTEVSGSSGGLFNVNTPSIGLKTTEVGGNSGGLFNMNTRQIGFKTTEVGGTSGGLFNVNTPSIGLQTTGANVSAPDVHVTAPRGGVSVTTPTVGVKSPAVQVNAPNVLTPGVQVTGPQVGGKSGGLFNINTPTLGLKTTEVGGTSGGLLNMNTPSIGLKTTEIGGSSDGLLNMNTPSIGLKTTEFGGTSDGLFNMNTPSIGLKTTEVGGTSGGLFNMNTPTIGLKTTGANVRAPDVQVAAPRGGINVATPNVGVRSPGVNINAPEVRAPGFQVTGPQVSGSSVGINANTPSLGLKNLVPTPSLQVTGPQGGVSVNTPSVAVKSTAVDVNAPDVNVSAPTAGLNVNNRSIGLKSLLPNVSAPSFNTTAPQGGVNVVTPSVAVKGPATNINTSGMQVAGPQVGGISGGLTNGINRVGSGLFNINGPTLATTGPQVYTGFTDYSTRVAMPSVSGNIFDPMTYRSPSLIAASPFAISPPSAALISSPAVHAPALELPVTTLPSKEYNLGMSYPTGFTAGGGIPGHAVEKRNGLYEYRNAYEYDRAREYSAFNKGFESYAARPSTNMFDRQYSLGAGGSSGLYGYQPTGILPTLSTKAGVDLHAPTAEMHGYSENVNLLEGARARGGVGPCCCLPRCGGGLCDTDCCSGPCCGGRGNLELPEGIMTSSGGCCRSKCCSCCLPNSSVGVDGSAWRPEPGLVVQQPIVTQPRVNVQPVVVNTPAIQAPVIQATTPSLKVDKPYVQAPVIQPLNINAPRLDLQAPNIKPVRLVVDQQAGFHEPTLDLQGPQVQPIYADIKGPNIDVHSPRVDVITPQVDVITPKVDILTPRVDVVTPKVDVVAPKVDVKPVKVDVKTPKAEIKTQKVEVKTPKVEVRQPAVDVKPVKVDVTSPRMDVKAPKVEVKTSKVKPVDINITPKVIQSDVDISATGGKVKPSKVQVKSPQVSVVEVQPERIEMRVEKPQISTRATLDVQLEEEQLKMRRRMKPERLPTQIFDDNGDEDGKSHSRWLGPKDVDSHQTYYPPSHVTESQRRALQIPSYSGGRVGVYNPTAASYPQYSPTTTMVRTGGDTTPYYPQERGRAPFRERVITQTGSTPGSSASTQEMQAVDYWKPRPRVKDSNIRSLSPPLRGGSIVYEYPSDVGPAVIRSSYSPEISRSVSPSRRYTRNNAIMPNIDESLAVGTTTRYMYVQPRRGARPGAGTGAGVRFSDPDMQGFGVTGGDYNDIELATYYPPANNNYQY